MEERLLSRIVFPVDRNSVLSTKSIDAIISLLSNPFTSDSTFSKLLDLLILHLQNPKSDHQSILSLLSSFSIHRPNVRRRVASAAREFILDPSSPTPVIPQALSLLDSSADSFADETLFLSLCFWPCVKTRRWMLRNLSKFRLRMSVFLTVVLGLTKDPYPYIRKAALDAIVTLMRNNLAAADDLSLIRGGYFRAVELLFDADVSVRCSAVHAVGELGRLSVSLLNQEASKRDCSDALFLQLCLMARDMDMRTRVASFCELEKIETVSKDILLQTLSKKILPGIKEKCYPGQYSVNLHKLPATAAAFAFPHGLEDEFHEVRETTCLAMRKLTVLCGEFASAAVSLLIDVLNDGSVEVRRRSLEALYHAALHNRLKIEESHLEMLCNILVDSDTSLRASARKFLCVTKLHNSEMLKICMNSFFENLELYPLDEADVFNAIYKIGRSHGKFVISLVEENSQQLEPFSDGNLIFSNTRTAALLVLAISAPVSFERNLCSIPPRLFSYAVTLLDRISDSLIDLTDQHTILGYLIRCSRLAHSHDFGKEASTSPAVDSQETTEASYALRYDSSSEAVLQNVCYVWPLVKLGLIDEALQILRSRKEELRRSRSKSAAAIFALNLLRIVKRFAKAYVWSLQKFKNCGILIALSETETMLEDMLCRYANLGPHVTLHINELLLVTHILRASSSDHGGSSHFDSVEKMASLIQRAESIGEPTEFIIELKNSFGSGREELIVDDAVELCRSLFSLRPIALSDEVRYLDAEMDMVAGTDFDDPIRFVPGLPVGIRLDIGLRNVPRETRVWIVVTSSVARCGREFVSVDLDALEGGCGGVVAVFYGTLAPPPRCVKEFCVKVAVAMEGCSGKFVYLCREREVYLSVFR